MACLTRIIRLNSLCHTVSKIAHRNLTSISLTSSKPAITSLSQLKLTENSWIYKENDQIKSPLINRIMELPNGLRWVPPMQDPATKTELEMPTSEANDTPMEAARLIVIRRNKMKRHKLKKLRKRMKFEWAKRRQRRELKKEKAFQAILIQQCKDAEAFSAQDYVEERLKRLKEVSVVHKREKMSVWAKKYEKTRWKLNK